MKGRARAVVATLCVATLLLALALPLSGGLPGIVPAAPSVLGVVQDLGGVPAPTVPVADPRSVRPPGDRGPPSLG